MLVNARGDGGASELRIICDPSPSLTVSNRFEIDSLAVREFAHGAHELSFLATFSPEAPGGVSMDVGPLATMAGEDVYLIAARLVQIG